MRNYFIGAVFGVLIIIAMILLFDWYKTRGRVQEPLALPSTFTKHITRSIMQHKATHPSPTSKIKDGTAEPTTTRIQPVAYHYASTHFTKEKTTEQPPKKNHTTTSGISALGVTDTVKTIKMTETISPTPEAVLKYVLFSVSYDPIINAGETQSLQLTMSPRSALAQLDKVTKDKKTQQIQINDIEKIQKQYKYVSATLFAKNHCLNIEKKMPEEDKVYLPSINDSTSDQVWEWDLTVPEESTENICNLSLFIRFCLNQNDCIPSADPDKKFIIAIHVTIAHKIYTWFIGLGNLAHYGTAIATAIAGLIGFLIWIKKRKSS